MRHDEDESDSNVKHRGTDEDSPADTAEKTITEYHILKIAAELLLDFC